MAQVKMRVTLLRVTEDPEALVALGAKMCTSDADTDALLESIARKDQTKLLHRVLDAGHMSVAEHVSFTFLVQGVSRALLAQLTRHRIASFSVQSQRYVAQQEEFGYIVPPSIEDLGPEAVEDYKLQMQAMHRWYLGWIEKLGKAKAEDARFVLPNACQTRLIVTMNARELLHFFQLRCCGMAQWEIRRLAWKMLMAAKEAAPAIFADAGPNCVSGKCKEAKPCGFGKVWQGVTGKEEVVE